MKPSESVDSNFDPQLLSRIEDAGLNASAPPQQRWVDGWLVRFSDAKAKRARCINAVASGRRSLDDRLASCQKIFDAVGLPLIVRITPFSVPPQLDADLDARGLARFDDTRVMVLSDLAALFSPELDDRAHASISVRAAGPANASVHMIDFEAFAHRVGGFRGSPVAHQRVHAERLSKSPVPYTAFEMRIDDQAVACGQIAVEDDIVGLYDVYTAEPGRGRGYASWLCRLMLAEAANRGATTAYLQVEGDNLIARAVYHRLGFVDAYRYHYRASDPTVA